MSVELSRPEPVGSELLHFRRFVAFTNLSPRKALFHFSPFLRADWISPILRQQLVQPFLAESDQFRLAHEQYQSANESEPRGVNRWRYVPRLFFLSTNLCRRFDAYRCPVVGPA